MRNVHKQCLLGRNLDTSNNLVPLCQSNMDIKQHTSNIKLKHTNMVSLLYTH